MPIGLLKKIFGGGDQERGAATGDDGSDRVSVPGGEADPVKFVEFMVSNLVVSPDAVRVEADRKGGSDEMSLLIICDKGDMGRVIGKGGRTISAIRSLAGDAASRIGIRNLKVELQD